MEYIIQLWEKHLEPFLSPLWDSLQLWRTLALAFVTVIVLAVLNRQKILNLLSRKEHSEHDYKIFRQSDSILSEQEVYDALDTLEAEHASNNEDFDRMLKFEHFYDLEANKYLNATLQEATKNLCEALAELTHFIAYNFFPYPPGAKRTCLYPELNLDRAGNGSPEQMKKYEDYRVELYKFTKKVQSCYRNYRSLIKRRLLK